MRSKKNKKDRGISVNELLERERIADNMTAESNNANMTLQAANVEKAITFEIPEDSKSKEDKDIASSDEREFDDTYDGNIPEEKTSDKKYDDNITENESTPQKKHAKKDTDNINAHKKTAKEKNANHKNNGNKKRVKIGSIVLIAACVFVVLCFAMYMIIALGYYGNRFLKGTAINGNEVSNVKTESYIGQLSGNVGDYTLTIMNNSEETDVINGSDIKLAVSDNAKAKVRDLCSSQNKIMWPMGYLGKTYDLSISDITEYDKDALTSIVQSSVGYNLPQTIKNESASLKFKEGKYIVTPPTNGDEIDKKAYIERVNEYISDLKDIMVIQDSDVYVKTEELSSAEQALKTACDKANEIIKGISISVKMGDTNEDITENVMNGIISVDDKYNVTIDNNTINNYVAELGKKYNNMGITRMFKTAHGTEVQVKGGDYGCSLNTKNLASNIKNAVFNKKPLNTTVKLTKNVLSGIGTDIGKSYIEVDLTNQYLYMFIDGKKVKECPVVTGLPGERATPQGTYMLKNKMMDVPLVGENYVTPVKYWMPFNGGIGLHDAVWQSKFGGELYKTKGSHGCVNLMMKDAADIYKNAVVRMPVVCYYHARISSFQPIASSGPVQGTYRALTDKELKMRDDLLNGKKINDSNVVRDSVTDNKPASNNNAAAQQTNTSNDEAVKDNNGSVIEDIVVTPASNE